MSIYEIPTQQQAINEIRATSGNVLKGSCAESEALGDESYLIDCAAQRGDPGTSVIGGPFSIWTRKDKFLINVNSNTKEVAVRFTKYALANLALK